MESLLEDPQRIAHTDMSLNVKVKNMQRIVAVALRIPIQRETTSSLSRPNSNSSHSRQIAYTLVSQVLLDDADFSLLDALLVQLAPARIICPLVFKTTPTADSTKLMGLCDTHGIPLLPLAVTFTTPVSSVEDSLSRLLSASPETSGRSLLQAYETSSHYAFGLATLEALLTFLGLAQASEAAGAYGFTTSLGSDALMQLDATALAALHLLPSRATEKKASASNVLHVLNRGETAMGTRLLMRWCRTPLCDVTAIVARQDMVAYLLQESTLRSALLQEGMRGCPDLDHLAFRLAKSDRSASLMDLVRLYDAATSSLPSLVTILTLQLETAVIDDTLSSSAHAALTKTLDTLRTILEDFAGYVGLIEEVVDLSDRSDLKVNAKHDDTLWQLSLEMAQLKSQIDEEHDRVKAEVTVEAKCEVDKVRGFVFRVTKKNDEAWLSKIPGLRICQVLTNGVHFTSTVLTECAKAYQALRKTYTTQQATVLVKALEIAVTYVPIVEASSKCVAELDVLCGFAHAAAHAGEGYTRPIFHTDPSNRNVSIVGARHPCLELQDHVTCIPNDYHFDATTSRFQIITGPNMGGKSTYIRQLGVLVVMAQLGSFIPATSASLPLFDRVLARVGAGDAQSRGVSTFMAEMVEASVLLRKATSHSLVIVDELGRGTSTFDGYGLAYAIASELLRDIQCTTVFATHFHELTQLGQEQSGAVNKHVSTQIMPEDQSLVFTYKVKDGPCLESYGIHIASLTHFPPHVIACAKRKAIELEGCRIEPTPSGSDSGNPSSPSTLDSTTTELSGDTAVHSFLQAFAALPLATSSNTQVSALMATLMERVEASSVLSALLT